MEKALEINQNGLESIKKSIAFELPELKDLTENQLKKIAELVVIERYKEALNREVDLAKYNYQEMKKLFIENVSQSKNTKDSYSYAMKSFEDYVNSRMIENPLSINCSIADDWIYSMMKENKANSTVRRNVASLSSFFSFVERRSNGIINNVFSGTKARPNNTTENKDKFYSFGIDENSLKHIEEDFQKIIENVDNPELKGIIQLSMSCGLRVGAFENLQIHGNKFKTISKGKEIIGTIPEDCIKYLDKLGIKHNKPFEKYTDTRLKNLFKYHTNKLYNAGIISSKYSFHDLRHFFALTEYSYNKDIYKLSKLLNHTSIAITEKYLKGLKAIA